MSIFAPTWESVNSVNAVLTTLGTTNSTSYTDLSSVGPSVTANIGPSGMALVVLTSDLLNTSTGYTVVSYVTTGVSSIAASDTTALYLQSATSGANDYQGSWANLVTGLNQGSVTFKMQYRVTAGTGSFKNRNLSVIPL